MIEQTASTPVYMDYQATTPVDPRVLDKMNPYFTQHFGNAASTHCFGRAVQRACETARTQVAALIKANGNEIIFTSGATESNNLAIKGVAEALAHKGRHIISCVTEHKSVLEPLSHLEQAGFKVTYLPVDAHGCVTVKQVENALRNGAGGADRTILVTLMAANNEIGSLHPIAEIGELLVRAGVVFHVDAAQAVGKTLIDVHTQKINLLSLTAHKMYGPKGIGALFVDKTLKKCPLTAQIHGGGQEDGFRAGTLPVPLVVGLGEAAQICSEEMHDEHQHLLRLRQRLWSGINELGGCTLNGHAQRRLAGNLNVSFQGLDGERLLLCLRNIAVSSSSACSAAKGSFSHVLKALGHSQELAQASVRFGLGRFSTEADVDRVLSILREAVPRLRNTAARLREKNLRMSV